LTISLVAGEVEDEGRQAVGPGGNELEFLPPEVGFPEEPGDRPGSAERERLGPRI